MRMAVAFYVTGFPPREGDPEFPPPRDVTHVAFSRYSLMSPPDNRPYDLEQRDRPEVEVVPIRRVEIDSTVRPVRVVGNKPSTLTSSSRDISPRRQLAARRSLTQSISPNRLLLIAYGSPALPTLGISNA